MSGKLYLMSDIHGYFLKFRQMLKMIQFDDTDRMVILGDLVARGPDSIGLLHFTAEHRNILVLRGNHEQRLLQYFGADCSAGIPECTMNTWACGDGEDTIRKMRIMPDDERGRILKYIEDMPLYAVMKIRNTEYVLVHGAPAAMMNEKFLKAEENDGKRCDDCGSFVNSSVLYRNEAYFNNNDIRIMTVPEKSKEMRNKKDYDILINRYASPDACSRLPTGVTAVVGHTPTFKYGKQYAGEMIIRKDKIFLDCGAGHGYGLGCLQILPGNEENFYNKFFVN